MSLLGFDEGVLGGEWASSSFLGDTMNLNHWADAAWGAGTWEPESWGGIGLSEEPGIGLAVVTPPVDFVIQPRSIANYRQAVDIRAYRAAPRADRAEIKEMMQMYAQWKKAA